MNHPTVAVCRTVVVGTVVVGGLFDCCLFDNVVGGVLPHNGGGDGVVFEGCDVGIEGGGDVGARGAVLWVHGGTGLVIFYMGQSK